MSGNQTIKLQSSDNAEITVGKQARPGKHCPASANLSLPMVKRIPTDAIVLEREVVERSVLIKNMMEDLGDQPITDAIPIPNVCTLFALPSPFEGNRKTRSTRRC